MIIYADTDVCRWHLDQIKQENTQDLEVFKAAPGLKLAVFHVPYPYDRGYGLAFEQRLKQVYDLCDHVCILGSELHANTVDFIQRWNRPNTTFFLCGFVNGIASEQWMDWFNTSSHFYKKNPQVLDQLRPYDVKPKAFDILLGTQKYHRTMIYNNIKINKLDDRVIMTYLKDTSKFMHEQTADAFIWEDENLEFIQPNFQCTVTQIKYYGHNMTLSQVIPINVYNQTAYSIIAETCYDSHFSFYTEKIVKPILAERLFLVFSGQNYLKGLRELGFKTFDGIIDESYDSIRNSQERYRQAFIQMQRLIDGPQDKFLEQIRPIAEHNKQHMLETDWLGDYTRRFATVLRDHGGQN
jgi:hypothetical protein